MEHITRFMGDSAIGTVAFIGIITIILAVLLGPQLTEIAVKMAENMLG